jgi:hypothetical protein
MMDQLTSKYTRGFGLSLIIMMLFNAVLTIAKESFAPLLKGMAAITGHHWITHGIIVIVLFFVLGFIFSGAQSEGNSSPSARGITVWTIVSAVIGLILIGGFYLFD